MADVEFTGPDGQPFPNESSVGDAAWHGGFDMTLNGKVVRKASITSRKQLGRALLRIWEVVCDRTSKCA